MKQRTRIRRIKTRTYPHWIYMARQRRRWALVSAKWRNLSEAMREAYMKAREDSQ